MKEHTTFQCMRNGKLVTSKTTEEEATTWYYKEVRDFKEQHNAIPPINLLKVIKVHSTRIL